MTITKDVFFRSHVVEVKAKKQEVSTYDEPKWPEYVLLFDTETTLDPHEQSLLFGFYRVCRLYGANYECIEEGILHADHLEPRYLDIITGYIRTSKSEVVAAEYDEKIHLYSRSEFVERLFFDAVLTKSLIVAFNAPWDISRLSVGYKTAGNRGWTLVLSQRVSRKTGELEFNPERPCLRVTSKDSKSAFFSLTKPYRPEEWPLYKVGKKTRIVCRVLDLHTLGWALFNEQYSLKTACRVLETKNQKFDHEPSGTVYSDEVEYARQDVRCTVDVLNALKQEFDKHPIDLHPDKAISPASVGKAYLQAMGITPPKEKFAVSNYIHGVASQAYFGGRAECRIRNTPLPVVLTDFSSQYPTINSLLGNREVLIAESLSFKDATAEVRALVEQITLDDCFNPSYWKKMKFFARIRPDEDVVPVRAEYSDDGVTKNIGVNYFTSSKSTWLSGPDVIASKLLAGKVARIEKALRMVAHGRQKGLKATSLRGMVAVDPRKNDLFEPETWTKLNAFVKVIPQGDILPSRSKYNLHSHDWQVAINHLWAPNLDPSNGLWFSLPDVVASFLLTDKVPQIIDAFRLEAQGKLRTLNPVKLRGEVLVNPRNKDFFKVAIQERVRLASRDDLSEIEKKRLEKALKVLANATSYGIYAEMNRQESDAKVTLKCHGLDPEPYSCRVSHPEVPGAYCFPPLSSLITGAARLMLALLESSVIKDGGQFAMEDTDSMAIVSTEHGGDISCPSGDTGNPSGVVKALSWAAVREISDRFMKLNPYERSEIPGFPESILKIEDDNFVPNTTTQRQLYCLAISAKRYALFLRDQHGEPVLLREKVNNKNDRWSEHGLGHLLNPSDPESDDRDWIRQIWLSLVRQEKGGSRVFPEFQSRPAVGRTAISSPAVMRPLEQLNEGRQYRDQVKPFNFLTSCQVKPLGHPVGIDPERFHLIAPYQTDSTQWTKMEWRDQYSGHLFNITTVGHHGDRHTARVKSYEDVLQEYEFHPESKCADAAGVPCGKQTIGLLQRRHIQIDGIKYIGKESNNLEEVEAGLIHSAENVYTEYPDPRRDEWHTKILPALRNLPQALIVRVTGLSPTTVKDTLAERSRPRRKNQELLATIVRKLGKI